MDEALNLHILRNVIANLTNFRKRQFSCRDNALCSLLPPKSVGLIVCVVCLCRNVNFDLRTDLLCNHEHSGIRDDQRIRLDFLQLFKIFACPRQVIIVCQNIGSHIYLHIMFMCKADSRLHLILRKILCFRAQSKCLTANIHRICAKYDSSL